MIGTPTYTLACRVQGYLSTNSYEILITGPRNAGKTTLAHKLRTEAGGKDDWREIVLVTSLTDTYTASRKRLIFIETGGLAAPPLSTLLPGTAGIVFLVDATDDDMFPEARRMLDDLLKSEEVAGVPVVIFVNKIDYYGAVGPDDFLAIMGLDNRDTGLDTLRKDRAIDVMSGSVVLGQGVDQAIRLLAEHV